MADNFKYSQVQKLRLGGAGCTSTATSIILASFYLGDGTTLAAMSNFGTIGYITIEPGTSKEENISFTGITQNGDGTATLTGVTRGLGFVAPYTEVSANKKAHAGGAVAIVSNSAPFYNNFVAKDNDEAITGLHTFTQLPQSSAVPAAGADLINKTYADALVLGVLTTINVIVPGTAGETVAAGQLVYFDTTDNEWKLTDADTATTVNNVQLGIAQGAGTNGVAITGGVLLQGVDTNQSGLVEGDVQYAGNTAGAISTTPGTTEVTAGIAKSATELYFSPRFDQNITEDQQDALAGTSGTPSTSNKYVTDADTTSTPTANKVARFDSNGTIGLDDYAFGDGSDGDITVNSGSFSSGPISSNSLTRDAYFNNLTIDNTYTLNPNGYRIFVKGTLTLTGTGKIARNGLTGTAGGNGTSNAGNGNYAAGGVAGAATAGLAAGSISGALGGSAGGNGGQSSNGTVAGSIGVVGTSAGTLANSIGAGSPAASNGVAGVDSTVAGGGAVTGALSNTVTNPPMMPRNPIFAIPLHFFNGTSIGYMAGSNLATGGSGGGGGGATTGGSGGGGGAGGSGGGCGGLVVVSAKAIVSGANNSIQALGGTGGVGGNGGTASAGQSGGGGGGGTGGTGGVVVVVYKTMSGTTITSAAVAGGTGGAGGTGSNTGNTGTTGASGVLYSIAI